jgi:hypothetical protein
MTIANIKKHHGCAPLINYLLKPTKQAQIIESSICSEAIDRAISTARIIDRLEVKQTLARDLNRAFNNVNALNPRLGKNIMHLTIGFDARDGCLTNEFKAEVSKELMARMGFGDTYWVAIAHDRDDPEHGWKHDHDHIHIVASRVNSYGRTIPDRWDYPKTERVLRQIEHEYNLQPFIPFWEREIVPELYWMIHEESTRDLVTTKTRSRT